ncbi:MAG: phosphoribosylglycinamide formyltransferase [Ilumatobacteraceae bacterium]
MAAARRGRVVVLASGGGTNFQALVDATTSKSLDADIVALVTDQPLALVIHRAVAAGIEPAMVERAGGETRGDYDARLAEIVGSFEPDVVVLAGWMRLLTMAFLGQFPDRVINLHPALPGEFPGINAIERALEAAQRLGLRRTGVMVHFVPDEGTDDGPLVASVEVEIRTDDTLDTLASRVHAAEHTLLVQAVAAVLAARRPSPSVS